MRYNVGTGSVTSQLSGTDRESAKAASKSALRLMTSSSCGADESAVHELGGEVFVGGVGGADRRPRLLADPARPQQQPLDARCAGVSMATTRPSRTWIEPPGVPVTATVQERCWVRSAANRAGILRESGSGSSVPSVMPATRRRAASVRAAPS